MRPTLSHLLAFAAAVSTTLAGCVQSSAESPSRRHAPAAVVRVAPVVDTIIARPIVAAGTVAPADEAALGFKIGGVIRHIAVDEGDPVRAGQTLAVLDLREIDAGLAKARSGAEKSARDLVRMRRLYRDSVVTLAQLQDTETADEMARADLETAAVNRRYAVIVAPAAGVVLRRRAEPGENIAAGAPVLVVGTRDGSKANLVEIGLADRDVVSVGRGDPAVARFGALPGRPFPGRVTRIGAAADPTTGTYLVEVTLDQGGALAAGLVGTVEIHPKRGTPAALVPIECVLEADGAEATVYALSADGGRARRRRVTVAFIDGSRVAISHGLEGASLVLTDGAAYLDDGAAVRVAP